jgi:hypothetical protein
VEGEVMGYYIRILGVDDVPITIDELTIAAGPKVEIRIEQGADADWSQLTFSHRPDGTEIMLLERNPVSEGELGAEELQEFIDELSEYRPNSAAEWLKSYLPKVKTIYAFQLLSGTDAQDGWSSVHRVQAAIWKRVGGLLQADGEGITNEAGHTILWQFSKGVKSLWNMAVLSKQGKWVGFEMELGDAAQREAFLNGQIPDGVKLL